jgi:hypothetical protein
MATMTSTPSPLDELAKRDPKTLTRSERATLARRAERDEGAKPVLEGAALDPTSRGGKGECLDPTSSEALKALFGAAYSALWRILNDPRSTNQDRVAAFSAARLAAGIGKEQAPAGSFSIDMLSLLPKVAPDAMNATPEAKPPNPP